MELKPVTREQWVAALRSGEYKQGRGALRIRNSDDSWNFCCLGVACELAGVDWRGVLKITSRFHNNATPLAAMLNVTGEQTDALARYNDKGETFLQIADRIERGDF